MDRCDVEGGGAGRKERKGRRESERERERREDANVKRYSLRKQRKIVRM